MRPMLLIGISIVNPSRYSAMSTFGGRVRGHARAPLPAGSPANGVHTTRGGGDPPPLLRSSPTATGEHAMRLLMTRPYDPPPRPRFAQNARRSGAMLLDRKKICN